jgi:hypothetical protein
LVSLAPSDLHNPSKAESSDQHLTRAAQLMSQSLDHGVPLLPLSRLASCRYRETV